MFIWSIIYLKTTGIKIVRKWEIYLQKLFPWNYFLLLIFSFRVSISYFLIINFRASLFWNISAWQFCTGRSTYLCPCFPSFFYWVIHLLLLWLKFCFYWRNAVLQNNTNSFKIKTLIDLNSRSSSKYGTLTGYFLVTFRYHNRWMKNHLLVIVIMHNAH